jgi:hypothetical protein
MFDVWETSRSKTRLRGYREWGTGAAAKTSVDDAKQLDFPLLPEAILQLTLGIAITLFFSCTRNDPAISTSAHNALCFPCHYPIRLFHYDRCIDQRPNVSLVCKRVVLGSFKSGV